ncbi:MAG: type II secretion system F family protein [Actinomycetota bacterium]|nr:type II secretion system F family protein [Actinomycetota bacterium]
MLLAACALAAALAAVLVPGAGHDVVERRLGQRFLGLPGRTVDARAGVPGTDRGTGTPRPGGPGGGFPLTRLASSALVGAGVAVAVHQSAGRPHLAVLGVTAVGVGWAASALLRRGRARGERQVRRSRVVAMCDALTAELQSGAPPPAALATVAQEWPELRAVRDAADLGADVPAVLRELAHRPGGEPLAAVAAGWEVAVRSGAGLATVLDRIAAALRDDQDVRREVAASLAAPRATARMLAVLPVFGLGLGMSIGADPVGVLVASLPGALCLALGSALAVGGLFWVERIADRAEI